MGDTTETLTQDHLDAVNKGLGAIGIQGDLFYRDGTGLQKLAKGTAGQVLTMNGGATAPSWADAGGGGAWSVKSSGNFSGASHLNITGLTKFTKIFLFNVTQSGTATLALRTSTNSGSSYDSGGSDYRTLFFGQTSNSTTRINSSSSGQAQIDLGSGGADEANIEITIPNPSDTGEETQIDYKITYYTSAGHLNLYYGAGVRASAADIDAIRFSAWHGAATITGSYVCVELN